MPTNVPYMAIIAAIASGIGSIFTYGNIAISVLVVCLGMSFALNFFFFSRLVPALTKMTDTLGDLRLAINTLNERIGHHDSDDHKQPSGG